MPDDNENIISVKFDKTGEAWNYSWESMSHQPSWKPEQVRTGLPRGYSQKGKPWRTCQYFVKGLPQVCKHWQEGKTDEGEGDGTWSCVFVATSQAEGTTKPDTPTGFNGGNCDFLGRRSWCSKYEAKKEDELDQYVCVAPNPYISGLAKRAKGQEAPIVEAVPKTDIAGYNEADDGTGRGKCDCYGMGRGQKGCEKIGDSTDAFWIEKELQKEFRVCNYYRPWQMGFGSISPQRLDVKRLDQLKVITTVDPNEEKRAQEALKKAWPPSDKAIEEGATAEEFLSARLPLNFKLYNLRSRFQKCQWWDADEGSEFELHGSSLSSASITIANDEVFDEEGKITLCKCPYEDSKPYNHRILYDQVPEYVPGGFLTGNVWAGYLGDTGWKVTGGYVCNGARPECPCYSGKWIYVTEEKVLAGMPVTANQILELRFWATNWETQDQYNKYFTEKPNFNDPRSPKIYTFRYWEKTGAKPTDSRAHGRALTLCQPSPFFDREFDPDKYVTVESDIIYSAAFALEAGGTSAPDQKFFPTLIRDPDFPSIKPFEVIYPYYNDKSLDSEICKDQGSEGHTKRHYSIYGDAITIVGHTIRNKTVYAINLNQFNFSFVNLANPEYTSIINVPEDKRENVYIDIRNALRVAFEQAPDWVTVGSSNGTFGDFVIGPLKLDYNNVNNILICVDYGNGKWDFRKRTVFSIWCGGIINQNTYTHEYGYSNQGYYNTQPISINPAASAKFDVLPLGGSKTYDLFNIRKFDRVDLLSPYTNYSYSIVKVSESKTVSIDPTSGKTQGLFWGAVGNSNKVWVEIDDLNINYIYDWEVTSAVMTPKTEFNSETWSNEPIRKNAVPVTMSVVDIQKDTIPPTAVLLEPDSSVDPFTGLPITQSDDIRVRFLHSEWELTIEYTYQKLVEGDISIDETYRNLPVEYGAYASEFDRYQATTHTIGDGTVSNIIHDTVAILAHFLDSDGRVISTVATKLLAEIVYEQCRNIDIFYSYKAQGQGYALQPERGFCINPTNDLPLGLGYRGTSGGDLSHRLHTFQLDVSDWTSTYGVDINGQRVHTETPDCMDHDAYQYPGPMWFPFNSCRGYDMYDEWTICNNCQASYAGAELQNYLNSQAGGTKYSGPIREIRFGQLVVRDDFRYCGPYKYDAWGDVRGNWAQSCDCGCAFFYSDASGATPVFIGYARIREPIDLRNHVGVPPPFGNDGRNYVHKFLSQDYVSHQLLSNCNLSQSEWMPIMLDHTAFFMSFNTFESVINTENIDYSASFSEKFNYMNQLNFRTLATINEGEVVSTRYRFEDIIQIEHAANCSYPPPAIPNGYQCSNNVTYYSFKDNDVVWAWQEYWKDIERNTSNDMPEGVGGFYSDSFSEASAGQLYFVEYERPKYVYSFYKEEHRLITNEGTHFVIYTGPVSDPTTGEMTKYPTLSLDGAHPRPFEIIYSSYGPVQITWKDEGGDANVDASSNSDNFYEKADPSRGPWLHDPNTIFDNAAVSGTDEAEAAGRAVVTGFEGELFLVEQEVHKYYNRGIIANITRDRLDYLPKDEHEYTFTAPDGEAGGFKFVGSENSIIAIGTSIVPTDYRFSNLILGQFVWNSNQVTINSISGNGESFSIARLKIVGTFGLSEGKKGVTNSYVRPGVNISLILADESVSTPRGFVATEAVVPKTGTDIEEYTIEFNFLLGPKEMLTNRSTKFIITLTGADGSYISLSEMTIVLANYSEVKIETINVWERKYKISTASEGLDQVNPDGPGDNLMYNLDFDNSGLYFPMKGNYPASRPNEEIVAKDKMRSVFAGIYYPNREDVPVSYSTLKDIEAKVQQALYEEANEKDRFGDTSVWNGLLPTKIEGFMQIFAIPRFSFLGSVFVSEKLAWTKHALYKQFKQWDFWRPGGHQYSWGGRIRRERCFLFQTSPVTVYSGYYSHIDHYGVGTPLEVDPSHPIDPGNGYYSYRFYVQQAKYNRFLLLSGEPPEGGFDLLSSANMYNQSSTGFGGTGGADIRAGDDVIGS